MTFQCAYTEDAFPVKEDRHRLHRLYNYRVWMQDTHTNCSYLLNLMGVVKWNQRFLMKQKQSRWWEQIILVKLEQLASSSESEPLSRFPKATPRPSFGDRMIQMEAIRLHY